MLIDWFTVGAQLLNFLILVWLMKRFLYKPILHAIDEREKRIAAELADADSKKADAQKARDEFHQKKEEFDQQRAAMLGKATEEAKAERQRLLEEARTAADLLTANRRESMRSEEKNLHTAIRQQTQQEVFAIARKALTDLSATSLEDRMAEVFINRVREMNGQPKTDLATALSTSSSPVAVRSAFDIPAEQRAKIQRALNETFSADIPLRYDVAPDLIGGIELTANGQKVAWSIADFLTTLEENVEALLSKKNAPEAKSEKPKPEARVQ